MVIFFTNAKCQSKPIKSHEVIITNSQDEVFKKWVKDTLNIIKKKPDKLNGGLINVKFKLADDSLLLDEVKSYKYKSGDKITDKTISNVIDLLNEYNELPKSNYELSFTTVTSFSSSPISRLKYDYTFEFESIILKYLDNEIEYKYIRGRLSGKTVRLDDNISGSKKIIYDFVWKDNELVKVRINN